MQRYHELKGFVEGALFVEAEAWIERYRPYLQQLETAINEAASKPEVKAKLQDAYEAIITYRNQVHRKFQVLRQEQHEAATVVKDKFETALNTLETELQQSPIHS